MFCPLCGFEYTQKMNYCKRCGEGLNAPVKVLEPPPLRLSLWPMFVAIAALAVGGLAVAISTYVHLASRGMHGDELLMPMFMSLAFVGGIAGLLTWQLSRLITAHLRGAAQPLAERIIIREVPPPQLAAPTDPSLNAVEPPSVIEHTTRQFAGKRVGVDG